MLNQGAAYVSWSEVSMSADIKNMGSFVWSIAETLRGDFKQSEYGKVILPFVVLRRLDCKAIADRRGELRSAAQKMNTMGK